MGLPTTCIGAWPKPAWSPLSDWFDAGSAEAQGGATTARHTAERAALDDDAEGRLHRATIEAVADQVACGIDVPTDGEQRRENYVHYHCRHLTGIDFDRLTVRSMRDGAFTSAVPSITGPVRARGGHFLPADFAEAQAATDRPVKMTVPGPLTIIGTVADLRYHDDAALATDLADAVNEEIRALAEAGCEHVQVDEPVFAREPDRALAFGLDALERCFAGLPATVTTTVHLCCGYPGRLDDDAYVKADPSAYHRLAPALDASTVDEVSIEDAHRPNDLTLLDAFERTTVVLGSIAIARSRVETVGEITARLRAALDHIDRGRLVVAPDCGLGYLGRELAMTKLRPMTAAAAAL